MVAKRLAALAKACIFRIDKTAAVAPLTMLATYYQPAVLAKSLAPAPAEGFRTMAVFLPVLGRAQISNG